MLGREDLSNKRPSKADGVGYWELRAASNPLTQPGMRTILLGRLCPNK